MPTDPARTVVVFGATGAQGHPVASALLDAGFHVRTATRTPERAADLVGRGAQAVAVDLTDPDTVTTAAKGAELAFFHLPMGAGGGADTERASLEALQAAGVRHLVFNTGFALPDEPIGIPPLDGRIRLAKELAVAGATVLRPTGYMENFSAPWSAPLVAAGELRYPQALGNRVAWVTNHDVGACTVAAFQCPEAARGRSFRVAGPEALTFPEVAERLGRAVGRPVIFRQVTGGEYAELLAPFLGRELAAGIGAGYDARPPGPDPLLTPDTGATRQALGVTFTPLETWARRQDWSRS